MKINLLGLFTLILFITGCASTPTSLLVFNGKKYGSMKTVEVKTHTIKKMKDIAFVKAYSSDDYLCNYFTSNGCSENNYAKNLRVKYIRLGYDRNKVTGRKNYDKQFFAWEKVVNNVIKKGDTHFVVTIKGLSTKQRITTRVKRKDKKLYLGEALRGKLRPDRKGFVISGFASIKVPDNALSDKDKGARLILPIAFGKYKSRRSHNNDKAFSFQKKKSKKYSPDTFTSRYYGKIKGFKLRPKFAEYAGWINNRAMAKIKSAQKRRARAYKRRKDLEEKRFNAKKNIIKTGLKEMKLVKDFKQYSEVSEICDKLRKSDSDISSFNCSNYNRSKVRRLCEKKKNKYSRLYERDIDEVCPVAKGLRKQFLSVFGSENSRALNSVLKNYQSNNNVDYRSIERSFRYTRFDSDRLEKLLGNAEKNINAAEMREIRESSAAASRRSWQKMLSGEPSATDKIFKQHNKNMRDLAANSKRIDQEYKQQISNYNKPRSSGFSAKSNSYREKLAKVDKTENSYRANERSSSVKSNKSKSRNDVKNNSSAANTRTKNSSSAANTRTKKESICTLDYKGEKVMPSRYSTDVSGSYPRYSRKGRPWSEIRIKAKNQCQSRGAFAAIMVGSKKDVKCEEGTGGVNGLYSCSVSSEYYCSCGSRL